jgi:hypothetical protein
LSGRFYKQSFKKEIFMSLFKRELTLLSAAVAVVCIGAIGSAANAGEVYAFGVGVGIDRAYKTTTLDFILKERMGQISEVEGTLSLYYKENEDVFLAAFMIDLVYQWRWNIAGGLNFYAGPLTSVGLCLAGYTVTENNPYSGHPTETEKIFYDACWGIGAQTGVEYNFNDIGAPFILSANIRPELNIMKPEIIDVFSLSFHFGLTYTWK